MFESILVGADESPAARHTVGVAIEMAKRFSSTLHIVAAFSPRTYHLGSGMPDSGYENLNHEDDADALLQVLAFMANAEGVEPVVHAAKGNLIDALIETGRALDVELVVVGDRRMKGTLGVLGTSAGAVAHRVHCSILVVDTTE